MGNRRLMPIIAIVLIMSMSVLGFVLSDECDAVVVKESDHGTVIVESEQIRSCVLSVYPDKGYHIEIISVYPYGSDVASMSDIEISGHTVRIESPFAIESVKVTFMSDWIYVFFASLLIIIAIASIVAIWVFVKIIRMKKSGTGTDREI